MSSEALMVSTEQLPIDLYKPISFFKIGCNCDPTGSLSTVCSNLGGHCQCKPNVMNRQCDRCKPGFYGFGPEGCKRMSFLPTF